MPVISNQPENLNFFSPINYGVQIERLPLMTHYVQSVNIPGLSLGDSSIQTPFVQVPFAGDHLIYEDLTLTFKLAENLKNYIELYNWMIGLGFPDDFGQYREKATPGMEYSEVAVVLYNSSKNPLYTYHFHRCYPNFLSGFPMSSIAVDVDYVDITCNFKYQNFTLKAASGN